MESFNSVRSGSGTRQWSDVSHNVGLGCSHDCKYCYAASYATEKGYITNRAEWANEQLCPRRLPTKPGVVMFPTAHDITPFFLDSSISAISGMLQAGRQVLVVSKPHLECVKALCDAFSDYRQQLLFRFTIGSINQQVCQFWEPGAPSPAERIAALQYAFLHCFRTSVSLEPMLEGAMGAAEVFRAVEPYVSETIWIGKMNSPRKRVDVTVPDNLAAVELIEAVQCDEEIMTIYNALKHDNKVEWKDSILQVVNRNAA